MYLFVTEPLSSPILSRRRLVGTVCSRGGGIWFSVFSYVFGWCAVLKVISNYLLQREFGCSKLSVHEYTFLCALGFRFAGDRWVFTPENVRFLFPMIICTQLPCACLALDVCFYTNVCWDCFVRLCIESPNRFFFCAVWAVCFVNVLFAWYENIFSHISSSSDDCIITGSMFI